LGGCDGISGEHYISQGLFAGQEVNVFGFPWCKDEPKQIRIETFTANILCRQHNSDLSPVDSAGKNAFQVFRDVRRLSEARAVLKPKLWNVRRYRIHGSLLERWFLKTTINMSYKFAAENPIGPATAASGERPSCELVEIAYGRRLFTEPAGLYWIGHEGQFLHNAYDHVSFMAVLLPQFGGSRAPEFIAGAVFSFLGFRALLWLHTAPPPPLAGIGLHGEDWGGSSALYHLRALNFNQGSRQHLCRNLL
jgi:hypothetical protein